MAKELCASTKVTIKGKENSCNTFPEIWKLFKANDIECNEKTKEIILRVLFINGYMDLTEYGADVQLEVVW